MNTKQNSVFLTVSLKIHDPSTRKRNTMLAAMRQATKARATLYAAGEELLAPVIASPPSKKTERREVVGSAMASLAKNKRNFGVDGASIRPAIRDGVLRDVGALLKSRIGLLSDHDDQAGCAALLGSESGLLAGLDMLINSFDLKTENAARDLMAVRGKSDLQPISFVRYHQSWGFMLYANSNHRWLAWLPIGNEKLSSRDPLVDIRTGEIGALARVGGIMLPLEFGTKQAEIIRKGTPRAATLHYREHEDAFYLNVAVEMLALQVEESSVVIGVDRGIEVIAAYAIVDGNTTLESGMIEGETLRAIQRKMEAKLKAYQERGSNRSVRWKQCIDIVVHHVANQIVDLALKYRARVVLEDLASISNGPHKRKEKFQVRCQSAKNLNRQLSRAVYQKLETVLAYKLALHGLRPPIKVHAGGTSQTCAKCNHRDKRNRELRDKMKCVQCGHEDHADINASINIARRGQRFLAGGNATKKRNNHISCVP